MIELISQLAYQLANQLYTQQPVRVSSYSECSLWQGFPFLQRRCCHAYGGNLACRGSYTASI